MSLSNETYDFIKNILMEKYNVCSYRSCLMYNVSHDSAAWIQNEANKDMAFKALQELEKER